MREALHHSTKYTHEISELAGLDCLKVFPGPRRRRVVAKAIRGAKDDFGYFVGFCGAPYIKFWYNDEDGSERFDYYPVNGNRRHMLWPFIEQLREYKAKWRRLQLYDPKRFAKYIADEYGRQCFACKVLSKDAEYVVGTFLCAACRKLIYKEYDCLRRKGEGDFDLMATVALARVVMKAKR